MNTVDIKISDIQVGPRHRKDMGDLESFAQTIQEIGLLQPIGVTPQMELVFGERRLRAHQILGRESIPARIIDIPAIVLGEYHENCDRKDFTPSELVAVVESLRAYKHGGDRKSNQFRNSGDDRLTTEKALGQVGLKKDTYCRAKRVVEQGVPELVEAMDSGALSIFAASQIADLSPEEQRKSLRVEHRVVAGDVHDSCPALDSTRNDTAYVPSAKAPGWDQTPVEICKEIIGAIQWPEGEFVLEPFCGDGNFYNNLPKHVRKDWCEMTKGRDFFEYEGPKPHTIITNPPFRDAPGGKNLVIPCLDKCLQVAQKRVIYLLNDKGFHSLTASRMKKYVGWGWGVTHLSVWDLKKWRGRYYLLIWEQNKRSILGYFRKPGDLVVVPSENGCGDVTDSRSEERDTATPATVKIALPVNSVTHGDCNDLILNLPDCSTNLCLTNPP